MIAVPRDERMKRSERRASVDSRLVSAMETMEPRKVTKPYKNYMMFHDNPRYPSITLDECDITEESVYRAADELLKSHLYSAKTALPGIGCESIIIWVDFCFFKIKERSIKKSCERNELSTEGAEVSKKHKKYFYFQFEDDILAISPSFQALCFTNDQSLAKFGVRLRSKRFGFLPDRELRYLELSRTEEPFLSVELDYFMTPSLVSPEEYRRRQREEENNEQK